MYDSPFRPCGNSVLISVTSDASPAQQLPTNGVSNARFFTPAGGAWVAIGPTTSVSAVVPTTAAPANGILVTTGLPSIMDIGLNVYVSAVTTAGATATLYITPGLGG